MSRELTQHENIGTLIRVENPDHDCVLKIGAVYLIYDQKGDGLDLVCLSSSEARYVRVLERDREKYFRTYPIPKAKALVIDFLKQRASMIAVIAGDRIGKMIEVLSDLPGDESAETYVALVDALATLAKFERDLKDVENHVDFLAEFPYLEIDIEKPVKRRGTPSADTTGAVIGLKKSDTSVIACVQWANGDHEDVDVEDLVNVDWSQN